MNIIVVGLSMVGYASTDFIDCDILSKNLISWYRFGLEIKRQYRIKFGGYVSSESLVEHKDLMSVFSNFTRDYIDPDFLDDKFFNFYIEDDKDYYLIKKPEIPDYKTFDEHCNLVQEKETLERKIVAHIPMILPEKCNDETIDIDIVNLDMSSDTYIKIINSASLHSINSDRKYDELIENIKSSESGDVFQVNLNEADFIEIAKRGLFAKNFVMIK